MGEVAGRTIAGWYGRDGITVGVLALERDEDCEAGRGRVESGAPPP